MLMSNWITRNQTILPIGVDMGHSCLKVIQLTQVDSGLKVLSMERVRVPPSAMTHEQERRRWTTSTIRELLSRGHFKGRNAVSVLSADELQITSLRFAEAEPIQVDRAVRKEVAQRFNLNMDTDAIDYLLAGSVRQDDEVKNEYIVLAAKAATIESHISLLEEAGLQPVGIDAAPCALFRGFERVMRREEDRQRTVVFADVGYRYTTVVFGRGGDICLAKHIPLGMARFDEEIASKLDITTNEAESLRLRLQRDESVEDSTRQLVTDALVSAAEQLAKELSLCLRYHTVTFRGKRVERAMVAGGGAHEKVLLEILQSHLSIAVEPADPFGGLDPGDAQGSDVYSRSAADLALAIGLGLKGRAAMPAEGEPANVAPEPVLEGEQT